MPRNLSSKPARVLVTGAGGLLGGRLAALLAAELDVVGATLRSPAPEGVATVHLDLLDAGSIDVALETVRPEAVLHAAALAQPDRCESEREAATRLNAEAPAALARRCARAGVRLVHLSTDAVFPGDRMGSTEADPPAPILHYSRTKLAGERAVQEEDPTAAIARVALVIGRGHGPRGTGSESIAWALAEGRRVRLFSDQYRTPIDAVSLARACATLLGGAQAGLFHLGGAERVSRLQIGQRVAALFGLDVSLIDEVRQREQPPPAPGPLDVSLDSSRAHRELGWIARPLDEALRDARPRRPL
jgi:dTDP-4-dehydrorhamnose reductase